MAVAQQEKAISMSHTTCADNSDGVEHKCGYASCKMSGPYHRAADVRCQAGTGCRASRERRR